MQPAELVEGMVGKKLAEGAVEVFADGGHLDKLTPAHYYIRHDSNASNGTTNQL